jgi:hypothetical protein
MAHDRPREGSDPPPVDAVDDLKAALARERQRAIVLEQRAVALEEALKRAYKMAVGAPDTREA